MQIPTMPDLGTIAASATESMTSADMLELQQKYKNAENYYLMWTNLIKGEGETNAAIARNFG